MNLNDLFAFWQMTPDFTMLAVFGVIALGLAIFEFLKAVGR